MCCIIYKIGPMYCTLIWDPRGVGGRGGGVDYKGVWGIASRKIKIGDFLRPYFALFRHMVF
jgi:hypothetical protein